MRVFFFPSTSSVLLMHEQIPRLAIEIGADRVEGLGDFFIPALIAGLALFAGLTWFLYRRTMREAA
jgi:hypothetical protein